QEGARAMKRRNLPPGIYRAINRHGVEVFKVRASVGGRRAQQATFATLKAARAHLHGLHAAAARGPLPSLWHGGTFDDLLQLARDAHAAKHQDTPPLKHLIAFFAGRRVRDITRPLLKQYVRERQAAGAADASVK